MVALLTLGAGAWVGGFVTVFVLSRSSAASLDAPHRVRLFRDFGRRYGIFAAVSMALILIPAAVLTYINPLNTPALVILLLAIAITVLSLPAIAQARRLAVLRRAALDAPGDTMKADAVGRAARSATILRSFLGVGSVAVLLFTFFL